MVMDFSMDDFCERLSGVRVNHAEPSTVIAVHDLDPKSNLTLSDFVPYAKGLKIDVLWGLYAQKMWRP